MYRTLESHLWRSGTMLWGQQPAGKAEQIRTAHECHLEMDCEAAF